jgi:hypothetical protein
MAKMGTRQMSYSPPSTTVHYRHRPADADLIFISRQYYTFDSKDNGPAQILRCAEEYVPVLAIHRREIEARISTRSIH